MQSNWVDLRTREHVIADLSFYYVAYRVAKCGFAIESTETDYGYDATVYTYNKRGEVENGNIWLQLKATDRIEKYKNKSSLTFQIDRKDLNLWSGEPFPVYLILFDVASKTAYWVYLQRYLEEDGIDPTKLKTETLAIRIDPEQIVNKRSVRMWRKDKQDVLSQIGAVAHA